MASPPKTEQVGCGVQGCLRAHVARGYCKRHYRKFVKYGDPLAGRSYSDLHDRATDTAKPCSRCGELKPLADFSPNKAGFMGRAASCRTCWNAYCRERLQRPDVKERRREADQRPERKRKSREAYVRRRYGEDGLALELRRRAGEGCFVCGEADRVCIDHCHDSTAVRGLLCYRCNTLLGRVQDDPALLIRLAEYLKNPPGAGE